MITFWGCGAGIKKDLINRIGGYEPKFFLYMNEKEFSIRALKNGFKTIYCKDIIAYHKSSSVHRTNYRSFFYANKNNIFTFLKYYDLPSCINHIARLLIYTFAGAILYTGKSRLSSDIHCKVREAYEFVSYETTTGEEPKTRQALRNLKSIAFEMKNALLKEDIKAFGELLNENWENQKALHPSVTNTQIDEIFKAVMDNGVLGGKACGAGGGGCLLFYAQPDCEHLVRKKLEENKVNVIDFNFDFSGLQTWTG